MKGLIIIGFVFISSIALGQLNNDLAKDMHIRWEIIENNYKGKREFLSAFTLVNKSSQTLPSKGWSIFFNFPRMIQSASVSQKMQIDHINGDFYRLRPSSKFDGLKNNDSIRIEYAGNAWVVSISDAPTGLYIVWDDDPEKGTLLPNYTVKSSTELKQQQRYEGDKFEMMTPARVFENNKNIKEIPEEQLTKVFPTPAFYKETGGKFLLDKNVRVKIRFYMNENGTEIKAFDNETNYLLKELDKLLLVKKGTSKGEIILMQNDFKGEKYKLTVASNHIQIEAGTPAGMFSGIQSLKSLIPPLSWQAKQTTISIPTVEIIDSPRFVHRAFMLDVARNFQTKEQIFKTLDLMSLYKLNVFHFHFNDDEGWRIQIPGLPELTEVGGRRGHTTDDKNFLHPSFGSGPHLNSHGSGFYTRNDFIQIIKYAKERHIKLIPEIETPGHARAAIAAMNARYERLMKEGKKSDAEKYLLYDLQDSSRYRSVQRWYRNVMNVAMPSTYNFLTHVVDELRKMYSEAGLRLETIHFGGDEVPSGVWVKSPAVQKLMTKDSSVRSVNDLWYYYFTKVTKLMKERNMYVYGWEEAGMRKTGLDGKTIYIPNPDFVNTGMQLDVWNNVIGWGAEDLPYQLANAGYKVILSPVTNMYFDLAYHKEFDEPGYYWGGYLDAEKTFSFIPFDYFKNTTEDINGNKISQAFFSGKQRLTDFGKQNIPGMQGLLWSETLKSPQQMEYMMLPKLLALAERAWTQDPAWAREKDSAKALPLYSAAWSRFVNVLGKRELPRLDYYAGGFNYRIPTPGILMKDGNVQVNSQFPGLSIRYTTDGTSPDVKSKLYMQPILEKKKIKLMVFNNKGRTGRMIEVSNE